MESEYIVTHTLRCDGCGSGALVVNKTRLDVMEVECADCGKVRFRHFYRDKASEDAASKSKPGDIESEDEHGASSKIATRIPAELSPGSEKERHVMFDSQKYRDASENYGALARSADNACDVANFRKLEKSSLALAENEEWLSNNHEHTLHSSESSGLSSLELAAEEERVLRCLGAALLMQWNQIPTAMQRDLFDTAGTMGKLQDTAALRGQIARFLHRYKDGRRGESREGDLSAVNPDRTPMGSWENEGGAV